MHTSNYQAAYYITASSIDNMYEKSAVDFMTDFRSYFILYRILFIIQKMFDSVVYIYIYNNVQPVNFGIDSDFNIYVIRN